MTKTSNKLLILIVIFCSAFTQKTAHAEQILVPANEPEQFIIQLPDVDRETLIEQVEMLRGLLMQRKHALVQSVADMQLNGSDAIITVFMPGGLLYAGYKKLRYEQAVNELARVSADIEEFSSDLLAMQPMPMKMAIAQLP